jgi:hypothetical protein
LAVNFWRDSRKPNAYTVYQHKLKGVREQGPPTKSVNRTVSILVPGTGREIDADVTNTATLPISIYF